MSTEEEGWGKGPVRIKQVSVVQAIRMRPGMYVGGTHKGMQHHLVYNVLDNLLENSRAGRGDFFRVELVNGEQVVIVDNQPPFDPELMGDGGPTRALDRVVSEMGTLDRGLIPEAQTRDGLPIVRALSLEFEATAVYEGKLYTRRYEKGEPATDWIVSDTLLPDGMTFAVVFRADPEIFDEVQMTPRSIEARVEQMVATCPGLKAEIRSGGESHAIEMPNGMADLVKATFPKFGYHPAEPFQLKVQTKGLEFDLAIQWTHDLDERSKFRSWANSIRTNSGTHVLAVREALRVVGLNDLSHKICLSVFVPEPRYSKPTKDHLENPDIRAIIRGHVTFALEHLLSHNADFAYAVEEWRSIRDTKRKSQ